RRRHLRPRYSAALACPSRSQRGESAGTDSVCGLCEATGDPTSRASAQKASRSTSEPTADVRGFPPAGVRNVTNNACGVTNQRAAAFEPRAPALEPRTSDPGPRTPDPGPRTSDLGPRTPDLDSQCAVVSVRSMCVSLSGLRTTRI